MPARRKSITLSVIRCGATSWDESGRVHGATDLPLSEPGRAALMGELPLLEGARIATVYHPADEAAAQTASLAANQIGAATKAVKELAAPNLGLLEGISLQEFADRYPSRFRQWTDDPLTLAPPEGEPLADAADRVFKAVGKIIRRARVDEIGLVLHPVNLGLLRCWMSNVPLSEFRALLDRRPSIERFAVSLEVVDSLANAAAALPVST